MEYVKRINFEEEKDFLNRIGDPKGKVILSIGNGNMAPFFENVIISDITFDKMLKTSGNKKIIDAHNIDFPDSSIDVIYGWQVIHHLNIDLFFPELKRVLKSGGKAVFIDNAYSPNWRIIRKIFPKHPDDPREDLKEEFLASKAEQYGLSNFYSRRYNLFAYLFHKFMRNILGISFTFSFLVKLDKFLSRYSIIRNNLRNMVWSVEK
ncbi:MAG: methyltransferase domain-containing protein [Candidatus Omnitrophica bacterium]|nr:methyltransferase domain-containing protein [Candidatus Omnitrophota bacterium]